jgi:hypothetical protein
VVGVQPLKGGLEGLATELVAVVGEHAFELPAGCFELARDAADEL